jgi:hypothetical protein
MRHLPDALFGCFRSTVAAWREIYVMGYTHSAESMRRFCAQCGSRAALYLGDVVFVRRPTYAARCL